MQTIFNQESGRLVARMEDSPRERAPVGNLPLQHVIIDGKCVLHVPILNFLCGIFPEDVSRMGFSNVSLGFYYGVHKTSSK